MAALRKLYALLDALLASPKWPWNWSLGWALLSAVVFGIFTTTIVAAIAYAWRAMTP